MNLFRPNTSQSTESFEVDGRIHQPAAAEEAQRIGDSREGEKGAKGSRRMVRILIEIALIVAAAFAIAMLVQAFIIKPFTVHQVSMKPTLMEGDRILLSRLTYHFRDPKAGDVVVFHSPLHKGEDLVKRVVAVAGDRVSVSAGDLYVNGVAVDEPYLLEADFGGEVSERVVPEGHVFVMGDNRDESGDSRLFGPVDTDLIIGEALCIYWPIRRWGGL